MLENIVIWLAHASSPENPRRLRKTVFIFLLFLLPLLIIGVITYVRTYQILTELSLAKRQDIAVPVAFALDQQLNKSTSAGELLAGNPQIKEAVAAGNWAKAISIVQIFQSITNEPFIDRIFLADPKGTLMAGIPESGSEGQNFAFRDWYSGVMKTGKPYLSEVYKRSIQPQYNVVAMAFPIVDEQNLLKGILVLQIRLDNFLTWINDLGTGMEGTIYVVDQAGQIVAHPGIDSQSAIANYSEVPSVANLMKGKSGLDTEHNGLSGLDEVVAYQTIPDYGWGVVISEPVREVFAARDHELTILIIGREIILILFGFVLLLLLSLARHYADHAAGKKIK